ncbi:MAG: hypothetical protein QGH51_06215 [Planctomycetota bacterium]|jgi:hypothetical protein|nr:hypothetical protein [Planctomycetota bacterium]
MRNTLLSLFFLFFALPLSAQTGFRLEGSSSTVRSGDSVTLDVFVDNPNAYTLAGYQIQFGWDTEAFEMFGPPAITTSSVMTDLFASNSPPFGSGFSNCPSAGDASGRDASFSLSAALSPNAQFSGAVGHLFQVPYTAKQASQQAPVPFLITEFESCTGNSTILSDSSATSLALTNQDTSIEITPNLSVTGNFQIGGQADFEIHERQGEAWALAVGLNYLETDLGTMGTLFFDHRAASFTVLAMGTMGPGPLNATTLIPNIPTLSGRTVYAQALTGTGLDRKLSNMVSFVIT